VRLVFAAVKETILRASIAAAGVVDREKRTLSETQVFCDVVLLRPSCTVLRQVPVHHFRGEMARKRCKSVQRSGREQLGEELLRGGDLTRQKGGRKLDAPSPRRAPSSRPTSASRPGSPAPGGGRRARTGSSLKRQSGAGPPLDARASTLRFEKAFLCWPKGRFVRRGPAGRTTAWISDELMMRVTSGCVILAVGMR